MLERFPDLITVRVMGEGFTWDTQDRQRDLTAARKAWEAAQEFLADPSYRLVVLDELYIVLRYDYLDLDAVLAGLARAIRASTLWSPAATRSRRSSRWPTS